MINELNKLKDLALRNHYYCEDSWYSCPKHPDGSAKDNDGECDCGADNHNAEVLKVYASIVMDLLSKENNESLIDSLETRYVNWWNRKNG